MLVQCIEFSVNVHLISIVQEYVQVILRDPKVMSVLSKRRGEKGWRELQGEALRTLFLGLIRAEVRQRVSLAGWSELRP